MEEITIKNLCDLDTGIIQDYKIIHYSFPLIVPIESILEYTKKSEIMLMWHGYTIASKIDEQENEYKFTATKD